MICFRFSKQIYSNDISGAGSKKLGGRWNSPGYPVLYASYTISLSLLELLIYNSTYKEILVNMLMRIEIPDIDVSSLTNSSLKHNWEKDIDYSRFIGDEFLKSKKSLMLRIPSSIIPEEFNIIINPLHPDFKKVKIISAAPFQFDTRLFK